MSRRRVDVRLPEDLIVRVRVAAGDRGFTAFVERALESALEGLGPDLPTSGISTGAPATVASLPARPTPSRAPVPQIPGVRPASSLARVGPKRAVAPIPKKGK